MERPVEVRMSYMNLATGVRPDILLGWKNSHYIQWAHDAGYDGVELHCLHPVTREVLKLAKKDPEELKKMTQIKSGHVIFNPHATFMSVLTLRPDPLRTSDLFRPRQRLSFYNLALAKNSKAIAALQTLEEVFGPDFTVTTYPYQLPDGSRPYGEYQHPLIQTHPAVFNDDRTAEDFIKEQVLLTYDSYHALEAMKSGKKPLLRWEKGLTKMLEAGIVREFHVQVGRTVDNDVTIPSKLWLQSMVGENPWYYSPLGRMIRLTKSINPSIPFVIEVSIAGLVEAGLIKKTSLLRRLDHVQEIHQQLVDYVKRV